MFWCFGAARMPDVGSQGRPKGAQGEAKRGTEGPEGVPRSRVRGRGLPQTNIWPRFGAIFDEKNDKKAMRSYTVFKYPKTDEISMPEQSPK